MSRERSKWVPGKPTVPGLYWWLPVSESQPKLVYVSPGKGGKLYAEVQTRGLTHRHRFSRVYSIGAMAGRFSERLPGAPKTCQDPYCKDGTVLSVSMLKWVDCPLCCIISEEEVKA